MKKISAIQHDVADLVATALDDITRGGSVLVRCPCDTTRSMTLSESVPFGHKFALVDIAAGAPVVKYGAIMGTATSHIPAGAHVHTHNVVGNRARYAPDAQP